MTIARLRARQVGDADVLLLERRQRIDEHDDHFSKAMALSASATESFSSFSSMRERRRKPAVS